MDHDLKVQRKRNIFDIEQIKFAAFDHLLDIFGIAKLYHSPTGETGFYFQQIFIIRIAINIWSI